MFGKSIRMERIMDRNSGNAVIVPLDHGMSIGPIPGLIDMKHTVSSVVDGGATAVLMQRGIVPQGHRSSGHDVGLILHLSASTDFGSASNSKVLVATVEDAIKMGADAVSVHINLGSEDEARMLSDIGAVSSKCMEWGIPLIVMAYPRGPGIKDPFDPELVAHAARVGCEIGADLVKVSYTGDIDSFREVVRGALIPVLIAGGPKMGSVRDILNMVHDSLEAGGKGVSIGRNVFQHSDVRGMAAAISEMVLHGADVEEAMRLLG